MAEASSSLSPKPIPGRGNLALKAEFALLFLGIPALLWAFRPPIPILLALWLFAFPCLIYLHRSPAFQPASLWGLDLPPGSLRHIIFRFLFLAALLTFGTVLFAPDLFLSFPRQQPKLWLLVLCLYPILSVLPQGIVYRSFLFHRYRPIFPTPRVRILASSLAFAFTHIIFGNAVALLLTLAGGYLFAHTYERSNRGMLASLEHALYGDCLMTLGLGTYIYYSP